MDGHSHNWDFQETDHLGAAETHCTDARFSQSACRLISTAKDLQT